jgi:hypothetical protein
VLGTAGGGVKTAVSLPQGYGGTQLVVVAGRLLAVADSLVCVHSEISLLDWHARVCCRLFYVCIQARLALFASLLRSASAVCFCVRPLSALTGQT